MSVRISGLEEMIYNSIEEVLSEEPLTEEAVTKAQEIFDRATKQNVWSRKKAQACELSTSFRTWRIATTDYKSEATNRIQQARNVLFNKKFSEEQNLAPLVFVKLELPPSPKNQAQTIET